MPASPLAAALVGQQENAGLLGADPALLEAQPQINLAQALMKGSIDTSGASPLQALARIAQAAAGQSVMSDATKSLASAYANSAESMAKTLEQVSPGHPLIAALRSPDLATRMTAAKEYGKAMTLLGEPYTIEPKGQRQVAGRTVGQSTAPMTEEGALRADQVAAGKRGDTAGAAALGGVLTGKAATGEGVLRPPVPLPAAPPAGGGSMLGPNTTIVGGGPARPNLPPDAAIARPPGAAPAVPAAVPAAPGTANPPGQQAFNDRYAAGLPGQIAAAKANQAGATKAAEGAAEFGDVVSPSGRTTPPGQGPGLTEPLTTERGTVIPPVANQVLPTSYATAKPSIEAWQKKSEALSSGLDNAQQAEQRLNTIANAFKSFTTGSYATNKAEVISALKAVGINIPAGMAPSDVQTALHENYVETLQQLKASTSRFTQMEFAKLSSNREHPNLQPEANLQMLSEDIGTLRQQQRLAEDWQTAQGKGWKNSINFEAQWLKANPLPPFVKQAREDVGPLRGMPGAGAPAEAVDPNVKTINGQVYHRVDGNWFVGPPAGR